MINTLPDLEILGVDRIYLECNCLLPNGICVLSIFELRINIQGVPCREYLNSWLMTSNPDV